MRWMVHNLLNGDVGVEHKPRAAVVNESAVVLSGSLLPQTDALTYETCPRVDLGDRQVP